MLAGSTFYCLHGFRILFEQLLLRISRLRLTMQRVKSFSLHTFLHFCISPPSALFNPLSPFLASCPSACLLLPPPSGFAPFPPLLFILLLLPFFSPLPPPAPPQHPPRPTSTPAGSSWTSPRWRWSSRRARRCLRCPPAFASETCCWGTRASRMTTGRQLCGHEERRPALFDTVRHKNIVFCLFGGGKRGSVVDSTKGNKLKGKSAILT